MALSNNQKIAIACAAVAVLVLILWFIFKKRPATSEDFFDLTAHRGLPSCKLYSLPDLSTQINANMAAYLNSSGTDPTVKTAYRTALSAYQSTLAAYNNLPNCTNYCVGGSLNTTTGACICPDTAPIPYNYSGNIYCISNDLSYVTDGTVIFNPQIPAFQCNPANYNITGDNTCYNTSNKDTLASAQRSITDAIALVNNSPKSITTTYGKIGNFYIAGKLGPVSSVSLGSPVATATGVTSVVTTVLATSVVLVPFATI
jgi:hypothetical protein